MDIDIYDFFRLFDEVLDFPLMISSSEVTSFSLSIRNSFSNIIVII